MHFNNITRLYGSIYARLPCKPGKKAACLREGDYEAGHAITHVQTHVQSTVAVNGKWISGIRNFAWNLES